MHADEATAITRDMARAAADGDPGAIRVVVRELTPPVRVAVARALFQHGPRRRAGSIAQEVDDIAQEVFAGLFEDRARVLRSWDPDRGASLVGFVRLVAMRMTVTMLRSGRRTPWKDDPTSESKLEAAGGSGAPAENAIVTRQLAERLFERLRAELSPRGYLLFTRLIVDEEPVPSICADLGMTADAVYAWRGRFGRLAARLAQELEADENASGASDPRTGDRRNNEEAGVKPSSW
jgi:DNA-directed RNA polymerase specialized sigma24 family protein